MTIIKLLLLKPLTVSFKMLKDHHVGTCRHIRSRHPTNKPGLVWVLWAEPSWVRNTKMRSPSLGKQNEVAFSSIPRLKFTHLLLLGIHASMEFSAESSPDGIGSGEENPNAVWNHHRSDWTMSTNFTHSTVLRRCHKNLKCFKNNQHKSHQTSLPHSNSEGQGRLLFWLSSSRMLEARRPASLPSCITNTTPVLLPICRMVIMFMSSYVQRKSQSEH